jgi:hypothetical protein
MVFIPSIDILDLTIGGAIANSKAFVTFIHPELETVSL